MKRQLERGAARRPRAVLSSKGPPGGLLVRGAGPALPPGARGPPPRPLYPPHNNADGSSGPPTRRLPRAPSRERAGWAGHLHRDGLRPRKGPEKIVSADDRRHNSRPPGPPQQHRDICSPSFEARVPVHQLPPPLLPADPGSQECSGNGRGRADSHPPAPCSPIGARPLSPAWPGEGLTHVIRVTSCRGRGRPGQGVAGGGSQRLRHAGASWVAEGWTGIPPCPGPRAAPPPTRLQDRWV